MTFRRSGKRTTTALLISISTAASIFVALPTAQAAQSLAAVQAQVTALQIQASAIAESAQQSQVELIALTRSLTSVQAKDSVQTTNLSALHKQIGILATEQYKNGGLGQGMTLMFSSDPTQYLNSAQSLSVVETQNAIKMRKLAAADIALKATGAAAIALKFALRQLGSRYMFGGAGLVYWDCSGLTMRALQQAGISLPHSAAAQTGYGKSIPLNQIRPGDLVFFGQPIAHVGIYFGGGKMVDAPHSGARVRIESFGAWFGGEKFVAARRF